jgi:peptidoglycan/LPS O-acetylase OafA/YrhL
MPNRNLALDVARGVLSWTVVVVHIAWVSGYTHSALRETLGTWAVDGFIILSGFVITGLLLRKKEHYGRFIVRRWFRLVPAYLVSLGLALLVQGLPKKDALAHLGAHVTLVHGLIPNWLLSGSDMAILPPGWSVSLEWQLYLVAPLLVYGVAKYGLKVLGSVLVLALVCLLPPVAGRFHDGWSTVGAFLPQHLFWFVAGMTLYWVSDQQVLACWSEKWSQTAPRRFLVRLGEVSYSTYLIHWPIVVAVSTALCAPPGAAKAILISILSVPLILGSSVVLYLCVELPGIELGRLLCVRFKPASRSLAKSEAV